MLSKQNLFEKGLTLTLSQALEAKLVFQPTSRSAVSGVLHHAEKIVEEEVILSLQAKLHLSRSPALVVLPLLLSDENIQKTFQGYAGIWMTSLAVVIASKPSLARRSSDYSGMGEESEEESDEDTNSPQSTRLSRSSSPNTYDMDAHETRRKSVSMMISTIEGSDFSDRGRIEENKKRENYFKDLFLLRQQERDDEERLLKLDELRAFCEDPLDGNKLLFEYAKQRLQIAQQAEREHVDDITYNRRMAELQRQHKRIAFAALQGFKDMRSKAEIAHAELLGKTREWCASIFEKSRNEKKLDKAAAPVGEDGTSSALQGALPAVAYRLDNLEEVEAAEMAKLSRLEEALRQEREQLKASSDERAKARLAALKDSTDAQLAQQSNARTENLAALAESSTQAAKAFYSKFVDSMGSSAQVSLAAVDQRFVHGGVLDDDDRADLLDQIMWDMSERRWQANAADYTQRVFCHNLVGNLDEKLRATNKSIFKYELERVERINKYNAKNNTVTPKAL